MRLEKTHGLRNYAETVAGMTDLTAGAGAWVDWDVSALVPAGTKVIEVVIYNSAGASSGIRANGSATDRKLTLTSWMTMLVQLDSSYICERWHPAGADHAYYQIMGWFT